MYVFIKMRQGMFYCATLEVPGRKPGPPGGGVAAREFRNLRSQEKKPEVNKGRKYCK